MVTFNLLKSVSSILQLATTRGPFGELTPPVGGNRQGPVLPEQNYDRF